MTNIEMRYLQKVLIKKLFWTYVDFCRKIWRWEKNPSAISNFWFLFETIWLRKKPIKTRLHQNFFLTLTFISPIKLFSNTFYIYFIFKCMLPNNNKIQCWCCCSVGLISSILIIYLMRLFVVHELIYENKNIYRIWII